MGLVDWESRWVRGILSRVVKNCLSELVVIRKRLEREEEVSLQLLRHSTFQVDRRASTKALIRL